MEVRECYKHLIPFLTAKSFNSEKGFGNDNALDTDKIITNYYEEYMKHRNVKYSFKEELEIKRNAKSHFELYENRELTPQQLKIIYKFTECEWILLKDPLLKEESFSSFKISLEDCHDDESCIEFLYNFFKSKGIIDILEISEEKIKKEILIQSVNSRVNLTSLTKHGFSIIFYELLHVVLLDDTYSLLHLYF